MHESFNHKENETPNIRVDNISVYGIDQTRIASGFPMLTEYDTMEFLDALNDRDAQMKADARLHRLAACKGGESHDCALCGIVAQFNLTAPRYFWQEWQRYHFADIISSMSTMHRIKSIINRAQELRSKIKQMDDEYDVLYSEFLCKNFATQTDVEMLEMFFDRASQNKNQLGVELSEDTKLEYIKANLPEGLKLTARITTNYRQLKTMYHQRHTHRLAEWRTFCNYYLKMFPQSDLIIGE